ncbi:MAG: hypothetical protein Q4D08_00525, partial [Clostridia bacterium]|nr:hypothetical protein [Clostridia bacterium]
MAIISASPLWADPTKEKAWKRLLHAFFAFLGIIGAILAFFAFLGDHLRFRSCLMRVVEISGVRGR